MLKLKVCGMTCEENIRELAAAHPTRMGFIFHDVSPRCCRDASLSAMALSMSIEPVAVTVNRSLDFIASLRRWFDIVQLHGEESPDFCASCRALGFEVVKALNVGTDYTVLCSDVERYSGVCDALLLDSASASRGGSGKKFDWGMLHAVPIATDFWLSGGIGPDDIEALMAVGRAQPNLVGVDINSRFESSPGIKDAAAVIKFAQQLSSI